MTARVGARRRWHCTTDGVTAPCGHCTACRSDRSHDRVEHVPDRQARVLAVLLRQAQPTLTSVAEAAGMSRSTAHVALKALQAEGLVTWPTHGALRPNFECAWPAYMLEA